MELPIVDPATTGLIVVGASRFEKLPKNDRWRGAFQNAKEDIVAYFRNGEQGFGLPDDNILDVFDSGDADAVVRQVSDFLRNSQTQDLFLYACSHGHVKPVGTPDNEQHRFSLMVRESDQEPETYLSFDKLISTIENYKLDHVYYIVDSCGSGALHKLKWPQRCQTFFTANNSEIIGSVSANKDLPFTGALVDVLNGGIGPPKDETGPFLSIQEICEEVDTRVSKDKGASDTWKPQCSDRGGDSLSQLKVFQNNHPTFATHPQIIWARTMRFRLAEAHATLKERAELKEEKEKLEEQNRTLQGDNATLRSQLRESRASVKRLEETAAQREAELEGAKKNAEERLRKFKFRVRATRLLVLSLIAYAAWLIGRG